MGEMTLIQSAAIQTVLAAGTICGLVLIAVGLDLPRQRDQIRRLMPKRPNTPALRPR